MNLNEQQLQLLNQLQDIQLPDPVGWWPLSATWWMLIFMVGSLLIGLIWYYLDQKRRNAYRTEALERLNELTALDRFEKGQKSPNQQVLEINTLLKQVALTSYARADVAQLNDQGWLDFLAKTAKHIKQPNHLLQNVHMAYQAPSQDPEQRKNDLQALNNFKQYAVQWIKGHHQ